MSVTEGPGAVRCNTLCVWLRHPTVAPLSSPSLASLPSTGTSVVKPSRGRQSKFIASIGSFIMVTPSAQQGSQKVKYYI